MTTSPVAETAREAARRPTGQFGVQAHSESEIDLSEAEGAWTPSTGIGALRFGPIYTETAVDGTTSSHADLEDVALRDRFAGFQSRFGDHVTGEEVRIRTAMDTGAGSSPNLRVQLSLDGGASWEDEPRAKGTPVEATVSNLLAGYDRAEGYAVPWRRDDLITAPQRPYIFNTTAGKDDRAKIFARTASTHPDVTTEALEQDYRDSVVDIHNLVADRDTVDAEGLNRAVATHFEQIRARVAGKPDAESVSIREGAAEAMAQVLERGETKSAGRRVVLAHQLTLALAQDKEFGHALDRAAGPIDEHRLAAFYNSRYTG